MRHKNGVKQLGRTHSHRKAMFSNMVTSLFKEERIITTKQKGKELKKISEKLITRAKGNLALPEDAQDKRLHNKREVLKMVKNRDVMKKLFEDIALRFRERNGGYTRLYLIGRRPGDAAEMAIVELVERKPKTEAGGSGKAGGKDKAKEKPKDKVKDKKDKKKSKE
ncbi:MAG TPA: 50S ribosomal protein L17 [Spirochaetes bacterium]|nr:50S ribosomal protein L17 [Spirochaetota bacterium]